MFVRAAARAADMQQRTAAAPDVAASADTVDAGPCRERATPAKDAAPQATKRFRQQSRACMQDRRAMSALCAQALIALPREERVVDTR